MGRQTCRYQMEDPSGSEDGRCKGPEAAVNLCSRDSEAASAAGMEGALRSVTQNEAKKVKLGWIRWGF